MIAAVKCPTPSRRKFTEATQELVRRLFDYNEETGEFFWKVKRQGRHGKPGERAGSIRNGLYEHVQVGGKSLLSHRVAWLYVYGENPKFLDHINGIKSDNRIKNLRPATKSQNSQNVKMPSTNRTGAKGVRTNKRRPGRFYARITHNGKVICLGGFSCHDDAAHAYNKAAIKYFGDFAVLNPIGSDK